MGFFDIHNSYGGLGISNIPILTSKDVKLDFKHERRKFALRVLLLCLQPSSGVKVTDLLFK